jgi:molybdopterin converting factor small subunit
MVQVVLTANLQKYYPKSRFEVQAGSLREVLSSMDVVRPLFSDYILENHNTVRKHVNIFVNGELLKDKSDIDSKLAPGARIHIMQALSGG